MDMRAWLLIGEESWKALEAKIMGKRVRLDIMDIDRYKRTVGIIRIGNKKEILEEMKKVHTTLPRSERSVKG
jgi:hypothetical protein